MFLRRLPVSLPPRWLFSRTFSLFPPLSSDSLSKSPLSLDPEEGEDGEGDRGEDTQGRPARQKPLQGERLAKKVQLELLPPNWPFFRGPQIQPKDKSANRERLERLFEVYGIKRVDYEAGFRRYPLIVDKTPDGIETKLKFFAALGMTDYMLGKMVAKAPNVLGFSLELNVSPRFEMLRNYGLSNEQLCRILMRSPAIFTNCTQETFTRRLEFVHDLVGPERFANLVTVHPQLLVFNPDPKLVQFLQVLKQYLDIAEREEVRRVVVHCPRAVFSGYHTSLIPKIEAFATFYKSQGLSPEEARQKTKLLILQCPSLLGLSLQNRILPRLRVMKKKKWPLRPILFQEKDEIFRDRKSVREKPRRDCENREQEAAGGGQEQDNGSATEAGTERTETPEKPAVKRKTKKKTKAQMRAEAAAAAAAVADTKIVIGNTTQADSLV